MKVLSTIVLLLVVIITSNAYAKVAVIVNKSNPVSDISFNKLKQILEAREQYWNNHEKITLLFKPIHSDQTGFLIEKIYHIKKEQFEKYWFMKVYKGKIMEYPKILNSAGTINILVSEIPGAISFIAPDEISKHGNIKLLKVNGKLPDDDDYVLK